MVPHLFSELYILPHPRRPLGNLLCHLLPLVELATPIGQLGVEVGPNLRGLVVQVMDFAVADLVHELEFAVFVGESLGTEGSDGFEMHGVELHGTSAQSLEAVDKLIEAHGMLRAIAPQAKTAANGLNERMIPMMSGTINHTTVLQNN